MRNAWWGLLWDAFDYIGGPLSCDSGGFCYSTGHGLDGPSLLFGALIVSMLSATILCCSFRTAGVVNGSCCDNSWSVFKGVGCAALLMGLLTLGGHRELPDAVPLVAMGNTTQPAEVPLASFLTLSEVDTHFYARSIESPGDAKLYASVMERAVSSHSVKVAIVGGSASKGGGCRHCQLGGLEYPACGPCYYQRLVDWFAVLGVRAELYNGAVGGTGPVMADMCLETLISTTDPTTIDLFLVEYAVNTEPQCNAAGRKMDDILWRIRRFAPNAAILLLEAYAAHSFLDASSCFAPVAHYYGLASISWKAAVHPLLATRVLNREAVLEKPSWIHPNAEGHRQIASLLAHFLLSTQQRVMIGLAKSRPEPAARMRLDQGSRDAMHRLYGDSMRISATGAHHQCQLKHQMKPLKAEGWTSHNRWWACSRQGATFRIAFKCKVVGCGLAVGISESYYPLGDAWVHVDGRPILQLSAASGKLRARGLRQTTQRLVLLVPPCGEAGRGPRQSMNESHCGLRQGRHLLEVICSGTTSAFAGMWKLQQPYERHEFHLRSVISLHMPVTGATKVGDTIGEYSSN